MNVVVSNTSPIRYLTCIGEQCLLEQLFGKLLIPRTVLKELTAKSTPTIVRNFMQALPAWIEIIDIQTNADSSLKHLDAGERAAILLSERVQADWLLIDEKKGRLSATKRGLNVIGILGILELADQTFGIDIPHILKRLMQTNFKVSPSLINTLQERHLKRQK